VFDKALAGRLAARAARPSGLDMGGRLPSGAVGDDGPHESFHCCSRCRCFAARLALPATTGFGVLLAVVLLVGPAAAADDGVAVRGRRMSLSMTVMLLSSCRAASGSAAYSGLRRITAGGGLISVRSRRMRCAADSGRDGRAADPARELGRLDRWPAVAGRLLRCAMRGIGALQCFSSRAPVRREFRSRVGAGLADTLSYRPRKTALKLTTPV